MGFFLNGVLYTWTHGRNSPKKAKNKTKKTTVRSRPQSQCCSAKPKGIICLLTKLADTAFLALQGRMADSSIPVNTCLTNIGLMLTQQ